MTKPPQRKWEKQKPKADEQPKPPHTPMNVWKRPPKLPRVEPLTDRDRQAA